MELDGLMCVNTTMDNNVFKQFLKNVLDVWELERVHLGPDINVSRFVKKNQLNTTLPLGHVKNTTSISERECDHHHI